MAKRIWAAPASRVGFELEDFVQIGLVALIGAAERYDSSHPKRATFMTYAYRCIWGEIQSARAAGGLIPVPGNIYWDLTHDDFSNPRTVQARRTLDMFSLDYTPPGFSRPESQALDYRHSPACQGVEEKEREAQVRKILSEMSPRDRKVLTRRYGLNDRPPQLLRQVAKTLGLTKERVRQIEVRALERFRQLWAEAGYADLVE